MTELTDEQRDLVRTVRSVLDRESDPDKLWTVLCEQVGVAALAIPERYDGLGAGVRELQLVAEELGRGLTPSPLLGSAVLATHALLAADDDEAATELLPALAAGTSQAALAWVGPGGGWNPAEPNVALSTNSVPSTTLGAHTVDGTAHHVLDAVAADTVLAVARCGDELGLFELRDNYRCEPSATMDQTRSLATVACTGATARRLGSGDFAARLAGVRDVACAVLAAEQVGAAAQALAITVDYTKNRVQFGRPIGGFQALKHRMADLHVLVESARSAAAAAGEALDVGSAEAARAVLVAKVHCSTAFSTVAAEMIQLHGGIGITWEHDAHRYFKRAHSAAQLFGQPHEHLARLAGQLRHG